MMKTALTALIVAATMLASSASAFDADDLQTLLDTNECELCDLSGADLGGADLTGAILCNTTMPNGSEIYSGC